MRSASKRGKNSQRAPAHSAQHSAFRMPCRWCSGSTCRMRSRSRPLPGRDDRVDLRREDRVRAEHGLGLAGRAAGVEQHRAALGGNARQSTARCGAGVRECVRRVHAEPAPRRDRREQRRERRVHHGELRARSRRSRTRARAPDASCTAARRCRPRARCPTARRRSRCPGGVRNATRAPARSARLASSARAALAHCARAIRRSERAAVVDQRGRAPRALGARDQRNGSPLVRSRIARRKILPRAKARSACGQARPTQSPAAWPGYRPGRPRTAPT